MASYRVYYILIKQRKYLYLSSLDILCHLVTIFIIRMKFHNNKFLTTVAAAALALAVGACSSSSDDEEIAAMTPPATTDPAPEPTPAPTPAEQLTAANAAVTAANAMVAALTSSSTAEDAAAAYAALGAAQTALHAASSLRENQIAAKQAEINELQTQVAQLQMTIEEAVRVAAEAARVAMEVEPVEAALVTATAMVDGLTDASTQAEVTAARDAVMAAQTALAEAMDLPQVDSDGLGTQISGLDTQLSGIATMVADRLAQEAIDAAAALIVAKTAEAGTKVKAIGAEYRQEMNAGIGGSLPTNVVDSTYSMTIERPRSGTEIKIADIANAAEDDPKFAQAMDFGGGRTMHVRTMEATDEGDVVEEVVIVKTDIDAPKATAFAKAHPLGVNPKTDGGGDNQSLVINAANSAMIMTDGVASTGAGMISFLAAVPDNTGTPDKDETVAAFETAATFNGAPGTLKCAGTIDCTVTFDADGDITFGGGDD